jgi:hypothetical protein
MPKSKSPVEQAEEAVKKEAALKPEVASEEAKPEPVVEVEFSYVSKNQEPMFKVLYPGGGWRPALMNDGRLMWKISASEKDRFEAHHHFQIGRIIRHHG